MRALAALLALAALFAGCVTPPTDDAVNAASVDDTMLLEPRVEKHEGEISYMAIACGPAPPPAPGCAAPPVAPMEEKRIFPISIDGTTASLNLTWKAANPATEKLKLWVVDDAGNVAAEKVGPSPLALDIDLATLADLENPAIRVSAMDVVSGAPVTVQVRQPQKFELTVIYA